MNRPMSGATVDERLPKSLEQLQSADHGVADLRADDSRISFRKLTIAVVLGFWALQYVALSLLFRFMYPNEPVLDLSRLLVTILCALLSFAMVKTQTYLRPRGLAIQAVAALLMAVSCPLLAYFFSVMAVYVLEPGLQSTWAEFAQGYLYRVWVFASVSAIILALSYASDVREREQRIVGLQALAHSAQLRALRNQLNPHFLFNALNSIAALMSKRKAVEAEAMTENLADFLRATLALDPRKMITLDEELGLQRLYLAIEKVRFPDRLQIGVDTPPELAGALVPSLITQPLIENSIKYAVARSTSPVQLNVVVRATGEVLQVTIEDDGGDAQGPAAKGAQLGLANVAERLRAHYGRDASLVAAAKPAGGFRNIIEVPLRFS